jgi:murein hydrolase activator
MKYKPVGFLLLAMSSVVYADSYTTLLRRYEKQIKSQEKQLGSLRQRLAEKEREIGRWKNKAEDAKSAWALSNDQLEQTRAKMKTVRDKRVQVSREADAAQWKTAEQVLMSRSALAQSRNLTMDLYEKAILSKGNLLPSIHQWESERVLEKLVSFSQDAVAQAAVAQVEETALRTEEMKWQTEEQSRAQDVSRLHEAQQTQWQKWQDALRRKNAIEEEVGRIEQSAKALQVMLNELRDHRNQAKALQDNRPLYQKALASLKGSLPWPARGRVVQNFGRQFSDDLKQLVVSNGIKIDTGSKQIIRVVQEGKVIYASPFRHYGQLVIVQHPNALTSVYASLSETSVKEGQVLAALDQVGTTGTAGSFYFELRHNEQPINPLVYLAPATTSHLSSRRTYP